MKNIQGYLDITPADLKEIYKFAYRHALERITQSVKALDIMTRKVFSVKKTTPSKKLLSLWQKKRSQASPSLKMIASSRDHF